MAAVYMKIPSLAQCKEIAEDFMAQNGMLSSAITIRSDGKHVRYLYSNSMIYYLILRSYTIYLYSNL